MEREISWRNEERNYQIEMAEQRYNKTMAKIFSNHYAAACAGTLPEDFKYWDARSLNDDMADHPGITLLHASASRGHLPGEMDDENDPRWYWEASDGWTVRDAWNEYSDRPADYKVVNG
jgi:hypothetical protein